MALSDYNNSATYTFTNANGITSGEWSVPSRIELVAFGGQLGITTLNYNGYGLKDIYWSSSAIINGLGYYVNFSSGKIASGNFGFNYLVRLARTF